MSLNTNESQFMPGFRIAGSSEAYPGISGGDDAQDILIFNMGGNGETRGLYAQNADGSYTRLVPEDEVKGGANNLAQRLDTISNFASPNAGGIQSGAYYDNAFQGTASSTRALTANRIVIAPYYTSQPFSIDRLGIVVSTAVAGGLAKCLIYEAGVDGWPSGFPLLEPGDDLDCSTTGLKEHIVNFDFTSGKQYYVGVWSSSTQTVRSINLSSALNLGLGTAGTATSYTSCLYQTVTYGGSAPNWIFTNAHRLANYTPPSIRFRAI